MRGKDISLIKVLRRTSHTLILWIRCCVFFCFRVISTSNYPDKRILLPRHGNTLLKPVVKCQLGFLGTLRSMIDSPCVMGLHRGLPAHGASQCAQPLDPTQAQQPTKKLTSLLTQAIPAQTEHVMPHRDHRISGLLSTRRLTLDP